MAVVISNIIRVGASKWRDVKSGSYAYNMIKSQATALEMAIIDDVLYRIELDQPLRDAVVKLESQRDHASLPCDKGTDVVKAEEMEKADEKELEKASEVEKAEEVFFPATI